MIGRLRPVKHTGRVLLIDRGMVPTWDDQGRPKVIYVYAIISDETVGIGPVPRTP